MEFIEQFNSHPLERQIKDSSIVLKSHPGKVPIIVDRSKVSDPDLERHKYLVGGDLTIGEFFLTIRSKLKVGSNEALFLFVQTVSGEVLVSHSKLLREVYAEYKQSNGFLVMIYSKEETFG
jgi:hypothetical protein